jgi:hypothetical protein
MRSNALSKSPRFSEASTFFAVSTKRLWRSAFVSLGLVVRFRGMTERPTLAQFGGINITVVLHLSTNLFRRLANGAIGGYQGGH